MSAVATVERRRVRVRGVVQGVGFRPFVHRLATELGLRGTVGNDDGGVLIEIEGVADGLDRFMCRLGAEAPTLAYIDQVEVVRMAPLGDETFVIAGSGAGVTASRTSIPPDVATCQRCRDDVAAPGDRRHRYPFTNCTDCGPRFTIIRDLPYDRSATTMADFEMCERCRSEYHDSTDRRHHAQPIACPECGPSLTFDDENGTTTGDDRVLGQVQSAIALGRTVAIKGIGGYHLACDPFDDAAVDRLRCRKARGDKPFAVMVADLDVARSLADLDDAEVELLQSPARPIVLARAMPNTPLSDSVAPGSPLVGLLLPYSPLHDLLFSSVPDQSVAPPTALVMTSGNRSEEPIAHTDRDARTRLAGLADAFCSHDRPIEAACDDSVMRVVDRRPQPVRRSRGYAPLPVALPVEVPATLAVGGELKNTFCLAVGHHAWISPHIGDMANLETLEAFEHTVRTFERTYGIDPGVVAADLHPGYLTRRWAVGRLGDRQRFVEVQHHHAHVASLMAEHSLDGSTPIIGFAFDGTGYGVDADGTSEIWGGEVLVADYEGFERAGHLVAMPLPGGDEAVRNPCRVAMAYLHAAGLDVDPSIPAVRACDDLERSVVPRQVERGVGCVPTSSMGRLFDVVASVLGVRHRVGYEAQAAIELEAAAASGASCAVELDFGVADGAIDARPLLAGLVTGLRSGAAAPDLALAFHHAIVRAMVQVAGELRERTGIGRVGLTGGVFQNALLSAAARTSLEASGFEVLTHRLVPPNDGGLSLGQVVIAGVRSRKEP